MPVIDIHTHQPHILPDKRALSAAESVGLMLSEMERFDVAVSGLLGHCVMPGMSADEVRAVNRQTASMVTLEPSRFYGMAFVNPSLPASDVYAELECCLQSPHFRGIKLELDVNCRDSRLDLVMEMAVKYGVPVLQHSWYVNTWSLSEAGLKHQENRSEPHDVADLASRFPEARIIMAHLEGCGIRGLLDIATHQNVSVDTSGAQPFSGTIEYALEILGAHRILFGSDLFGRSLESQLGRLYEGGIGDAHLHRLLYRNAAEMFHLG